MDSVLVGDAVSFEKVGIPEVRIPGPVELGDAELLGADWLGALDPEVEVSDGAL